MCPEPCFISMCKPSNSFKFESKFKQYMFTKLHVHTNCIFIALIVNLNLSNYLRGLNIHILWSDTGWPSWYSLITSALALILGVWLETVGLPETQNETLNLVQFTYFRTDHLWITKLQSSKTAIIQIIQVIDQIKLYNGSCNSYVLIAL